MNNRELVFEFKLPRDFEKRQNELPNKMMMGSKSEILLLPKYQKLREINGFSTSYKENRDNDFWNEVSIVLGRLHLSFKLRDTVLKNANIFYEQLGFSTYHRGSKVLIPVSIYLTCLERFIFVKRSDFYRNCSKKAFDNCFKEILRNNDSLRIKLHSDDFRIKTILVQLNGLRNNLKLRSPFFSMASECLYQNYNSLKNSKITVITGRIFALVKKNLDDQYNLGKASNFLGIARSSIYIRRRD